MELEMADWLRRYFPAIVPSAGWGGDSCWLAFMMTRQAEHNPPFYWLGRAFDTIEDGGASELLRARLHAAHGDRSCDGVDPERDESAQDVLSEACAYAWAAAHLGPPQFEVAAEGVAPETGPVRLCVAAHEAYVAVERLRPRRSMQDLVYAVGAHVEAAADRLPQAAGRIVYLDTWHEARYAQGVGYRIELTEPLLQAARHFAAEHGVGHVLTRPFEWGRTLEAWY
jgi:hypothetical protein